MSEETELERQRRLRDWLRDTANSSRDSADEISLQLGGCDDPMHPWKEPGEFRDWQDFVDRVARPLVEAEDAPDPEAATQAAMKLFRTANPYFLCVSMVMMDNRLKEWESRDRKDWPDGHLCTKCGQLAKHHPFLEKGYECDRWRRD